MKINLRSLFDSSDKSDGSMIQMKDYLSFLRSCDFCDFIKERPQFLSHFLSAFSEKYWQHVRDKIQDNDPEYILSFGMFMSHWCPKNKLEDCKTLFENLSAESILQLLSSVSPEELYWVRLISKDQINKIAFDALFQFIVRTRTKDLQTHTYAILEALFLRKPQNFHDLNPKNQAAVKTEIEKLMRTQQLQEPCQTLGISSDALTTKAVNQAYRQKAKQHRAARDVEVSDTDKAAARKLDEDKDQLLRYCKMKEFLKQIAQPSAQVDAGQPLEPEPPPPSSAEDVD